MCHISQIRFLYMNHFLFCNLENTAGRWLRDRKMRAQQCDTLLHTHQSSYTVQSLSRLLNASTITVT